MIYPRDTKIKGVFGVGVDYCGFQVDNNSNMQQIFSFLKFKFKSLFDLIILLYQPELCERYIKGKVIRTKTL